MPEHVIVVERSGHWRGADPGYPVITAAEYLSDPAWQARKGLRVVNLCRTQRYLGEGYYCSLLAEARGHRVIPGVRTIRDLSRKSLYSLDTEDLGRKVQRLLGSRKQDPEATSFSVTILFGQTSHTDLRTFARELFELFRAPLLRASFELKRSWRLTGIRALGIRELDAELRDDFDAALGAYLSRRWQAPRRRRQARYDLAILHDPAEHMPPSDERALKRFVQAARRHELDAELITRKDLGRLGEFDALFIRETTAIDHYTYHFSRKAAAEGLVVIDDPDSILRCTNKIYLAELLKANRIATPPTAVVREDALLDLERHIPYPIVLKVPDGSFSRGVFKVHDRDELKRAAKELFKHSELLLGQAYTYTPFDWRVGIIDRQPLYVCQYFMTKDHWQIYDHAAKEVEGDHRTFPVDEVAPVVVETALKAANLIGDGFYGVDLKPSGDAVAVIEVNDNPSIDAGVEDQLLGDALYDAVMRTFVTRLDAQRRRGPVLGVD